MGWHWLPMATLGSGVSMIQLGTRSLVKFHKVRSDAVEHCPDGMARGKMWSNAEIRSGATITKYVLVDDIVYIAYLARLYEIFLAGNQKFVSLIVFMESIAVEKLYVSIQRTSEVRTYSIFKFSNSQILKLSLLLLVLLIGFPKSFSPMVADPSPLSKCAKPMPFTFMPARFMAFAGPIRGCAAGQSVSGRP